MFEIGDRVCSIVNYPDDNQNIVIGSVGTVVNIDYNIICVEWDDDVEGHTCDGTRWMGTDGMWKSTKLSLKMMEFNMNSMRMSLSDL